MLDFFFFLLARGALISGCKGLHGDALLEEEPPSQMETLAWGAGELTLEFGRGSGRGGDCGVAGPGKGGGAVH